ncbi:hypothetical protein BGZ68_002380 [Mortierella alpina]|nr:hypothetical protein BGZ68_002380 [Mortierella alpina]
MFRKFCLDVLSATLLSPSVILLSLKYIQQLMINLKESNKIVNTGDGAEYRFFTGALILANKFLDDNTFTNKTWADITGMKIKDVNHLEMQFLNGIDFRLFTSPAHYSEWLANLTQFTGAHMPSQHLVACQQQTSAAQSPISPMEDTTLAAGMPSATTRHLAPSGAGIYSSQPSAPSALSMASISNYIDSVKQLQQKPFSGGRYQRNPTSSHHTQPPLSSVCNPPQQQYMTVQQQPVGGVSFNRQSTSFSSSPTTLTYGHHQRLPEPAQRKRSANIAFDDTLDYSPRSDPVLLPHAAKTPLAIPTHKRYSSSSSMSTLMGLNCAQDMFHDDQSPMLQPHQRSQHRHQRSMELSQRSSSGALSTSFRAQHQRSASGSYFMNGSGTATPSCRERCQFAMSVPNSFKQSGAIHPLEEMHGQCCHQEPRSTNFTTSHSMQRTVHPLDAHSSAPRYPIDKNMSPCHSMGCGTSSSPCATFEMDPRLWGPLDSLSLYAITTQAAKRVVAQGKALSASANGLHMFYPTTLA